MAFLKFGKKRKGEPLDIPLPSPDAQPIQQSSPIEQVLMMKQQAKPGLFKFPDFRRNKPGWTDKL